MLLVWNDVSSHFWKNISFALIFKIVEALGHSCSCLYIGAPLNKWPLIVATPESQIVILLKKVNTKKTHQITALLSFL